MMTRGLVFILAWLVQSVPAAQAPPRIECEFRSFDGGDEVTHETRVLVYADGRKDNGMPADSAGRVALLPGLYDVQMTRERAGHVIGTRRVEHLLIMRYPDDEGRHVEAMNFKPQYGALQLRVGNQTEYLAAAYAAGDRTRPIAGSRPGEGYVLLIVPAGRYDVRLTPKAPSSAESWLTDVDVPADRTRLRTVGPAKQIPG